MWDRGDDRWEDVGLCGRCLEGVFAFPPATRVDELRTTVGVAEEVVVAILIFTDRPFLKCDAFQEEWIIS